tara:strand:- start:44 stop:538 length:495 start_codon:yes stop_codon:yes gene_type:complete
MMDDWTDESDEDMIKMEVQSSDDEALEKPRTPPPSPKKEDAEISAKTGRPKKKLTQKQLDALARGRASRDTSRVQRKDTKAKEEADKKKRRNEAIVKKAREIKKKEAIEQAMVELSSEESEDDVDTRKVKRAVAKSRAKKVVGARKKKAAPAPAPPAAPQYVFY